MSHGGMGLWGSKYPEINLEGKTVPLIRYIQLTIGYLLHEKGPRWREAKVRPCKAQNTEKELFLPESRKGRTYYPVQFQNKRRSTISQ